MKQLFRIIVSFHIIFIFVHMMKNSKRRTSLSNIFANLIFKRQRITFLDINLILMKFSFLRKSPTTRRNPICDDLNSRKLGFPTNNCCWERRRDKGLPTLRTTDLIRRSPKILQQPRWKKTRPMIRIRSSLLVTLPCYM